jgi:uncharacterized protein YdeI (BOF family)
VNFDVSPNWLPTLLRKILSIVALSMVLLSSGSCGQAMPPEISNVPFADAIAVDTVPIAQLTSATELTTDVTAAVDMTVHLQGEVVQQVPLLNGRIYQLQDDSGSIWVVSTVTELMPGDQVVIQGIVRYESIPLGAQDFSELYIEEVEQLDRQSTAALRPDSSRQSEAKSKL